MSNCSTDDNPFRPPGGVGAYEYDELITQSWCQFWEYARAYSDDIQSAIDKINDIITETPPVLDIPVVDDVVVPGSNFPQKPSFGELALKDLPEFNIADPVIVPIGNFEFEYVAPTAPDAIAPDFSWNPEDYTSDMWFALFTKVHNDILNGGSGLTAAVYSAIVERERTSRLRNQNREYRQALDAAGSRGFDFPSGHIAAIQNEFNMNNAWLDQDALNNLMVKDFDLATANTQFATTSGIELEKMLRTTFATAQDRSLAAAKAASDYIVAAYEANIKLYLSKWEAIKMDLDVMKTRIDAIIETNNGAVKVYIGQVDAYQAQIQAISAGNEGMVAARNGEIKGYATEVDAAAAEYDGLNKGMLAQLEKSKLEVSTVIESNKGLIDIYTATANVAVSGTEMVTGVAGQIVASALGAINSSISTSYGVSV